MGRVRLSRALAARSVVLFGAVANVTGVFLLVGIGWALVVAGGSAILFGLTMDVDGSV